MWNVLNGSYDDFMPLYKDGVNGIYFTGQEAIPSEIEAVYLSEETENWNEGLDRDKTKVTMFADANQAEIEKMIRQTISSRGLRAPCRMAAPRCFS